MKQEIDKCRKVLAEGGTILYPTDTIWGIGCDATRQDAVSRVYSIKQREDSKAMLVLVDSIDRIYDYIEEMPEKALEILNLVSPKPLTIVYPGARGLAGNLVAEDGSIGIRVSSDPFSRDLIRAFGKPIVSSSANIAGHPPPSFFPEIRKEILEAVDHIAGWRQDDLKKRKPSGILKVYLDGVIEIIRE